MKKFIISAFVCCIAQLGFAQNATDMSTPKIGPEGTMNFAVMDTPPQLTGCENAGTTLQKNKCTADKIESIIQNEFNSSIARTIPNNTADNGVYIRFVINKQGKIEKVGVRTKYPALRDEVARIIQTLPTFTRGSHKGTAVNVTYAVTLQADRLLRNAVKN